MKIKQDSNQNKTGIHKTIETIETTPNDGFIPEKVIRPVNTDTIGKYHKGYSKTKVYTTNDPRITRPFAYGVCLILFIIGILMLLTGNLFFSITFITIAVIGFVKSKKDIDKVAERLKKEGYDVTVDSEEEKNQLREEVKGVVKSEIKDIKEITLKPDRVKFFIKTTIIIYSLTSIIISLLLGFLIKISLGLLIFIILLTTGFIYYLIISKILKNE